MRYREMKNKIYKLELDIARLKGRKWDYSKYPKGCSELDCLRIENFVIQYKGR